MVRVGEINQFINEFAPSGLAEEWDNTGLLVGDPETVVQRVMTCLTITPESAGEAIERGANLIVTHHPLPFRAMKRLTTEQTASRLLLDLIKAEISVISPHTAFDSAAHGINARLAGHFQLDNIRPLIPSVSLGDQVGAARVGTTAAGTILGDLLETGKAALGLSAVRFVGQTGQVVQNVALCCGSGGSFLDRAIRDGCDAMVTGEATFHTCLEAKANNCALVLLGHYASERFAVEELATLVGKTYADLEVWASERESDPIFAG